MRRSRTSLQEIRALAAALAERPIEVKLGSVSSWNHETELLTIAREAFFEQSAEAVAGVVSHELGHAAVTRYHLVDEDFFDWESPLALHHLLNACCEARCEAHARQTWGVGAWIDRALAEHDLDLDHGSELPSFVQFYLGAAFERGLGWRAPEGASARVVEALERTREDRRRYVLELPDTLRHLGSEQIREAYLREVVPVLTRPLARGFVSDTEERRVQVSALRALRILEANVLPEAQTLFEADIEVVCQYLGRDPGRERRVLVELEGFGPDDIASLVRVAFEERELGSSRRGSRQLARTLLERAISHDWPSTCGHGSHAAADEEEGDSTDDLSDEDLADLFPVMSRSSSSSACIESRAPLEIYRAEQARVASQIDELAARLLRILPYEERPHWRSGFPSGGHLDLKRVLSFEATGNAYDALWMRRVWPRPQQKLDCAFGILCDCSGSMAFEKAHAALAGVVVLVEMAERLGVPTVVLGFQDEVIPLKSRADVLDDRIRENLGGIPLEALGTRPGKLARNRPGANDDGPCVVSAGKLLVESCPEHYHRTLIVIGDAQVAGTHSDERDLADAISRVRAPSFGLTACIGVGIGWDTELVAQTYGADSLASVPVERFSEALGDLFERVVRFSMRSAPRS